MKGMYKLTAADFADTGQWRLLLKISQTGLEAFLTNTIHTDIEPQILCTASWEPDRKKLLKNIEETIYNNPRLLDDFATRIILFEPHTLFIPTEIAEESAGAEENIYRKVYKAEEQDIMTDSDSDITAAWSMAPGIKSFLLRTFPGARITCNLMDKFKILRKNNEGLTLHIYIRGNETDFILLNENLLISASTHPIASTREIEDMKTNLLKAYEFDSSEVKINVHENNQW